MVRDCLVFDYLVGFSEEPPQLSQGRAQAALLTLSAHGCLHSSCSAGDAVLLRSRDAAGTRFCFW